MNISQYSQQQLASIYSQQGISVTNLKSSVVADTITKPIILQIVNLDNVTTSKLNQISDILDETDPYSASSDRLKKRPKVIRNVHDENQASNTASTGGQVYYKVTLMDQQGDMIYGLEVTKTHLFPTALGNLVRVNKDTKIMLNVLMLHPNCVSLVTGRAMSQIADAKKILRWLQLQLEWQVPK